MEGRQCCATGGGWDEEHGHLVTPDDEPARIGIHVERVADDSARTPDAAGLVVETLPTPSELPDHPLVLDATATPAKVAAFYGVDQEAVRVDGNEPLAMPNLHTTQVLDGQYHAATIRASETAQERIQQTITHMSSCTSDRCTSPQSASCRCSTSRTTQRSRTTTPSAS